MFFRKKHSGFTIIELLVVIAIIVTIISIVIVSINAARAKARDTKRQAEVQQMEKALEIYRADNGVYPHMTLEPWFSAH